MTGEYLFRQLTTFKTIRAWHSFDFCENRPYLDSKTLVIVISHRGTKKFSADVIRLAHSFGCLCVLITGLNSKILNPTLGLSTLPDFIIFTSEQEKSSAHTVSHTGSMTCLLSIAIELGCYQNSTLAFELQNEVNKLPELIKSILKKEEEIKLWAKQAKSKNLVTFVLN